MSVMCKCGKRPKAKDRSICMACSVRQCREREKQRKADPSSAPPLTPQARAVREKFDKGLADGDGAVELERGRLKLACEFASFRAKVLALARDYLEGRQHETA